MTEKHSPNCARCGAPATGWSGAWVLEDGWIGWCSNDCRNAWLAGDKVAPGSEGGPDRKAGRADEPGVGSAFSGPSDLGAPALTSPSEPEHAYIGVAPCGCVFSACIDNPKRQREVAQFCKDAIKDGEHIERVTVDEARYRLTHSPHGTWCHPPERAEQLELVPRSSQERDDD